jgi:hypothetical protein
MKKTALVLGLSALTLYSCGKHDSGTRPRNYQTVANTEIANSSQVSQNENSLVQLRKAGMSQMSFIKLKSALGKIDIANFLIEENTPIVLIETLDYNTSIKGYNKMIDGFNSLYASDNEALMESYQLFADENCKKIYGCVGTVDDRQYDWKIIKFLPNPERCNFEPTITMSNVMLYK